MRLQEFSFPNTFTRLVVLLAFTLLRETPLFSQDLTVCLEIRANLDADTLRVFSEELQTIARSSGFTLRLLRQPSECHDIRLTIQPFSRADSSALGAARVKDGHILPEIDVYASSVAALLRSTLPALAGRGLARVAAHEIGHYVLQTTTHSGDLMSEYYTAARLMVKDHRSFRIPFAAAARTAKPIDQRRAPGFLEIGVSSYRSPTNGCSSLRRSQ